MLAVGFQLADGDVGSRKVIVPELRRGAEFMDWLSPDSSQPCHQPVDMHDLTGDVGR